MTAPTSTSTSSASSGSVFSPTGNRSEQQNREQDDLPSLKVLKILQTGLVEKDVDELIEVLRNMSPNPSNSVKTPTQLYDHMSQEGDVRVKRSCGGDVSDELLIKALERIGQTGLACDLKEAIDQDYGRGAVAKVKTPTPLHDHVSQEGYIRVKRSCGGDATGEELLVKALEMTGQDRLACALKEAIQQLQGDGGVVSWTGVDDMDHNNEPPSKRKKARKEEVDRYNLTAVGLVAVINNFVDTEDPNARLGTIKDENAIVKLFSEEPFSNCYKLFDYDVNGTDSSDYSNKHNRDLDNKAMNEYLDKLNGHLEKKKDEYSSFILFIMSHGTKKGITPFGSRKEEDEIPVEDIMKRFEKVLLNKPKVIVIQACQGKVHNKTLETDNFGHSSGVESDTTYRPYIPPPKGADMLVAFSTIQGYFSYRYQQTGSVYIQNLMRHIAENNKASGSKHLGDILTGVHDDVSQWKDDITEAEKTHYDVRQMPYYQSSFRRNFFLLPCADGLS